MREHLAQNGQVLLFLNRRGYAPILMCHACGWHARCPRCDAHLTYHRGEQRLRCHHCASERPVEQQCPECGAGELLHMGLGTERIEAGLHELFSGARILRIDRDTTRRKGAMQDLLAQVHSGAADILLGTQMLAKGHHFPEVSLVAMLDADYGLYSADFRASERMGQLILQVAGRAGRAERPGEVLIQTHHPDHPLLAMLVEHDYPRFADSLLQERAHAELPPFTHLALLRAESVDTSAALGFLQAAREAGADLRPAQLLLLGPLPAPMEKRAGRYRAQLLVQSAQRQALQQFLHHWLPRVEALPGARKVRWSLDVDPQEMF
jgi:primosomal protein N' (replication factor Y)